MAQSRINQLDLGQLLAADKNTGAADAINSGVKGVETGVTLAEALQAKRLTQMKAQADIAAKVQELKNKTQELANQKQKIDQNSVPVTTPATLANVQPQGNQNALGSPANAPVASYDPTADAVTPSTVTKQVSPEAFNAMNPDPIKSYGRELNGKVASGQLTKEQAANSLTAAKVPESFTPLAEKPPVDNKPGAVLLAGSKSSTPRNFAVPPGYQTAMELSGTRGQAMEERNKLAAADKIRTELNPSHFADPQAKLAAVKVAAAQRFEPLLQQMLSQPGGGDKRQLMETARQLDNMVTSNGQSSEAITQSFMPDTLKGKVRSFQEFVQNSPTGQDAQDFINRTADTMHREADVAKGQVHQYQVERIGGLNEARKLVPDTFNSQLRSLGMDPALVDENGVYHEQAPAASPTAVIHNEALDWANAHPTDPRSAAIKAKATQALGGK